MTHVSHPGAAGQPGPLDDGRALGAAAAAGSHAAGSRAAAAARAAVANPAGARRAEIVAIGDELTHGHSLDTNSRAIARALEAAGADVHRFTVVGDATGDIETALREAGQRSRIVVVTGGLGPTEDDRTRAAAAAAADTDLRFDASSWQQIEARFRALDRTPSPSNRLQAWLPATARALENRWGTAPGFELEVGRATLFALPGVPREMLPMLDLHVLPRVAELLGRSGALVFHDLHVLGITEAELGERIRPWMAEDREPRVGVTAHYGQLSIRIAGRGADAAAAAAACAATAGELRPLVGDLLAYEGREPLHELVGRELIARGTTFAVAESCTGGLVAARLTEVPGISRVFLAGVVTYANEAKVRDLGVPETLLAAHGAVSVEVAAAMALGIAARTGAHLGAAVTGIAGPAGGTADKPVGTVCFALAQGGEAASWQRRLAPLGRTFVRERAVLELLVAVLRRLGGRGGMGA